MFSVAKESGSNSAVPPTFDETQIQPLLIASIKDLGKPSVLDGCI